ncbi:hypothetical protein [Candidatus Phytoplasma solani]|uniref:hypothetical protein n=1 Tax=Candidatus Phytoplasma solani TaxID=69896 RepID=UPI00358FDDF5
MPVRGTSTTTTVRKKATVAKTPSQDSNENKIHHLVKLLLLNFFITPLLFFLTVFLCNETINILISTTKNTEGNTLISNSIFFDFLFKTVRYDDAFKSFGFCILFYRWFFLLYMVFVIIFNITKTFKNIANKN